MRYDFTQMNADTFELMVRSLNENIFGMKCEQYGLGPDGQREFTFEGEIRDGAGNVFAGKTIGQAKYKYLITKEDDYKWLTREIDSELKRFREKEEEYIPDNYFFFTNVVLTPAKGTGIKDRINAYVEKNNDIIAHFYVKGYDDICAMLENNRDVARCYAHLITSGDVLMELLAGGSSINSKWMRNYLYCEFQEEMYTRMEQAGSATEKKISIEKVCVDINVQDRELGKTIKFAEHVFSLGNQVLGYKKQPIQMELEQEERVVLIGGPGNGKSTICQFIAQVYRVNYLLAMECRDQEVMEFASGMGQNYNYEIKRSRVPFKMALRDYAAWINRKEEGENVSVMQYIRDRIRKIQGENVTIEMLRELLKILPWIFFFDGLDEVPESFNRQEVLKQIRIFLSLELKEAECDCMVIGTTRAQGYNKDFDEKKYKHLEVAEFSKEDCTSYIEKLFGVMEEQTERREEYIRIMMEALEDEITARLMKTPLQTAIIAILVKSGGKPPHERYALFRQYYDTVIRREKQKEIVATLNDHTDWLEELHYLLGYWLQRESEKKENPAAEISRATLEEAIRIYVEENWDDFYGTDHELAEKKQEFLLIITQRICFLCENREGYYSFQIRSIQEYFAGTCLIKGKSDQEAMDNIRKIAYSSYWRNVLLFAFGYIELERKSLEPEISRLCEQMNGKDNIMREDYTSENLCLFGSWLAVDMLGEHIFRGKQQEKYIMLAAKAMDFTEYAAYNAFSLITGVQRDKLLRYVREYCCQKEEDWEKALRLYLKLNENFKNDLEAEILDALEHLTKERQTAVCTYILEHGLNMGERLLETARCMVEHALEQGEISYFLPYTILHKLVTPSRTRSLELKRELFLQCLHCSIFRIKKENPWEILGVGCKIQTMVYYLLPHSAKGHAYIPYVEECLEVVLYDRKIDKGEVREIQREMQKLNLQYLSELCDFLLEPSFAKYQRLCADLEGEAEYLAEEYRALLKYYAPYGKVKTEEEYQKAEADRRADYDKFIKGDDRKLYSGETDVQFNFCFYPKEHMLDELAEKGKVSVAEWEKLSRELFECYVSAANFQLYYIEHVSNMEEQTADRLLKLVCEAERRKFYHESILDIIAVLIVSKFKKRLWECVPDIGWEDKIIEEKLLHGRGYILEDSCIGTEELRNIIGSIIGKVLYEAGESNYLAMIPFFINAPIDIRRCVSEHDMEELKRIKYRKGTNILAVKLLELCMDENEHPAEIMENLLDIDVSRIVIYKELRNMLYFCRMENKERLRVELCLRLEDEEFEGRKTIQRLVIEDMLEAKRKVAVEEY